MLAMLAERRWDPFRATAQQVSDALALFPSGTADSFLDAPDLASIFELVRSLISEGSSLWKWANVFTHQIGSPVSDDDMVALEEGDSLMGWTMANVLKRSMLSDRQLARLTGILANGPDPTVRWRAAHALGAHPAQIDVDALFRALDDTYHWVVYGPSAH